MTDETSHAAVGDSVASALEEKRNGRAKREPAPLTHCENCGTELRGHYCFNCGQAAVNYHRSFRHVIVDVLDSFLNWDSKFIRTIGLLLWRPGWLTNQFIEGRRVRFVHPLRLYLLVSIVFFLCAKLIPVSPPHTVKAEDLPPEARARFEEKMAKLRAKHKEHPFLNFTSDEEIAKMAKQSVSPDASSVPDNAPAKDREAISPGPHFQFGHDTKRPRTPFENWLEQRVKDRLGDNGTNAKLFIETLRSNLSTMMLFCIPLFAFVLKILYVRQKRFYIQHLIYALNIHAFFYLAVILVVAISLGFDRWIPGTPQVLLTLLLSALVLGQIFLSIRAVYRQSWFMTAFKFAFGGIVYLFVLAFAVAATAFVTFALPT